MPPMDAGLVFLPRFTTLIGETEFTTAPLDVSGQAGTQFQVWRGPLRSTGGTPLFTLYLEESLDTETWALGPSTPQGFTILENATQFFAYSFRLRWFRLRFKLDGTDPMVSCWAEGILRAGDGGMWGTPVPGNNPLGVGAGYPDLAAGAVPGRPPVDAARLWAEKHWTDRRMEEVFNDAAYYNRMAFGSPGSGTPWMPNSGVPVTPPQLGVAHGP